MPASTRPNTLARRQGLAARLLELAETQIAATGLASLRARALAEAAGCSVGAIYGVFPDLDKLVLLVNARTLDGIEAALARTAGDAPAAQLVCLAEAYLSYASQNRPRWDALFQHRMAAGRPLPEWFVARRHAAFQPLSPPLAALRPDLSDAARAALARSVFAAVHGMVALGLDGMLAETDLPALRTQVAQVVRALGQGLAAPPQPPRR